MTLLAARNLSISLGGHAVLTGLDFAMAKGEVVGLIGPNGAGKTTLLRAIAGLLPLEAGEVEIEGRSLQGQTSTLRARSLAYLPQNGASHWDVDVESLVMLGRLPHQRPWHAPSQSDWAAVERALEACDVTRFRRRSARDLSGGERARVLLARALAGDPKLLLADEPVAGLDPGHQLDVMERLRERAALGAGIVVVMHDLTLAARFCDRLALLHGTRIAHIGRPEEVLSQENLERCYGVRAYFAFADDSRIVVPLARSVFNPDRKR